MRIKIGDTSIYFEIDADECVDEMWYFEDNFEKTYLPRDIADTIYAHCYEQFQRAIAEHKSEEPERIAADKADDLYHDVRS